MQLEQRVQQDRQDRKAQQVLLVQLVSKDLQVLLVRAGQLEQQVPLEQLVLQDQQVRMLQRCQPS